MHRFSSSSTAATRKPWARVRPAGTSTRNTTSRASVAMYSESQYAVATGRPDSSVPVGTWWNQASAMAA